MSNDLVGVSIPFRIGNTGGIALSRSNYIDHTHLDESIQQILSTYVGERIMERVGGNLDIHIFDINDVSSTSLLSYEICQLVNDQESRVTVKESDISYEINENELIITIGYTAKDTGTYAQVPVPVNLGGGQDE